MAKNVLYIIKKKNRIAEKSLFKPQIADAKKKRISINLIISF